MIDVTQQRELIKQAVDGDTQALEQLLLANCDAVAAHIRPKLAGPLQSLVSVEDILQETFFRAFQQIGKFKPKSDHSFQAWLKTIAENRILDTIKHQKRKKRGGEMQRVNHADAMFTTIADLVVMLADEDEDSPSHNAATDEAVRAMQVAIASLPDEQQQAVMLRYFRQKSLEEAGQEMERSPEAIRGLLRRARLALRQRMQRTSIWLSRK
ncbi:MAG: hypothetical protein CMJ80_02505 [Planctomycetaceae bacterium]|nr:hypothetical protein [Planctomycetaceae bacterium]